MKISAERKRGFFRKLYVNDPNDQRIIVEKRIGYGYTINFATKGGKILFFFIVVLPFILSIFLLIMYSLDKIH
jgi:uncharacterized membrane protein